MEIKKEKFSISFLDSIAYYGTVIFTFGAGWILKSIIEKAIIDAFNRRDEKRGEI